MVRVCGAAGGGGPSAAGWGSDGRRCGGSSESPGGWGCSSRLLEAGHGPAFSKYPACRPIGRTGFGRPPGRTEIVRGWAGAFGGG